MLVSHNLGLTAELCDEVAVMYAGEIIEHASVNEIFFDATHPYTQALLKCNPALDLKLDRLFPTISGDVPDLHRPAKGCVFTPRCPKVQSVCRTQSSQIQEISSAVNEVEHSVRCHLHDPKLSHVFTIPETQLQNGRNRFCTTEAAGSTGDLNSLLEISQLRVRYENMSKLRAMLTSQENWHIDAVLDVSLKVRKGETLGLVGECGSGKTTLGLSVLGLNKVHSGSVKFQRD